MHKFLKLAIVESQKYPTNQTYSLCAVIVSGGRVLSIGLNSEAKGGFVQSLATEHGKHYINTHAEVDAILRARNKIDLGGCKIYVARMKPTTNEVAMARPCSICQNVLYRYGIKRAIYTIDDNNYGILNIKKSGRFTDNIVSLED